MSKFTSLFRSRKFWALVASTVAVLGAWHTGTMDTAQAANTFVAALGAYSIGTGIEANGTKR